MSWITEIAGKAENFLNAVDKGAANALTNANKQFRKHSINKSEFNQNNGNGISHDTEYIDTPEIMSIRTSASTNSLISENGNNNNNSSRKSHTRTSSYDSNGSRNSKINDDDRLMEYLNKDNNIPEEEWQTLNDSNQQTNNNNNNNEQKLKTKNDIKELDLLNKKLLELNSEFKKQKLKAQNYYNQNIMNEKLLRELQLKENDLITSINAKDTQITSLKLQIEQFLIEINDKDKKYKELEQLYEKFKENLQNKSNDNELIINLQNEIESLKKLLEYEKNELKRIQENNNQQIIRLEDNQRSLIDELDNYRKQLNEQKSIRNELEIMNNSLKKKLEQIEQEYEQYKCKTIRTIKDKDDLMATLYSSSDQNNINNDNEYKILQEKYNTITVDLIELRNKYDEIKLLYDKNENEILPKKLIEINKLMEQLNNEKNLNKNLLNEIDKLKCDRKLYQDDLNQIKSTLSLRINERDEEIDKLRKQLILKQQQQSYQIQIDNNNEQQQQLLQQQQLININDWEQRIKSLNDNLMEKQLTIEQLTSTNHSLKLQLEKSEKKLLELINNQSNNDVAIGIYHSPTTFTNLIKHRNNNDGSYQSLIHDDPNDGQVTRKVKRAYTAIDTFSIRLGNFLRLYPSARAAFLLYIIILHVWVAFVLMYYEPEIHNGTDFN